MRQVRIPGKNTRQGTSCAAVAGGTAISLVTLAAFAHGMTGSWTPAIPPPEYVAVAAAVAVLTFLTTEASARSALRRSAASVNVG
jgi:putative ABC transport system permease protein